MSEMSRDEGVTEADVVIIGGGLVGGTLALALDQARFNVVVVDRAPLVEQIDPVFDGRASAIANASFRMWRVLGVAEHLNAASQRIEDIVVADGRARDPLRRSGPSLLNLHFDRRELDPRDDGEPLGFMVENRQIRKAVDAQIAVRDLTCFAPAQTDAIHVETDRVRIVLEDGRSLSAKLVIGCDGRNSFVRRQAGIRTVGWGYDQSGLVATVAHDQPHHGVAYEYFLPSGPFAILPLTDNRSNLVWTERPATAKALTALDEAAFARELERRFGDFLGEVRLAGPRWSYPLRLDLAERYVAPRLALAGDAAHAVHPIAGQGLNMGLRDVAALAETLSEARDLGQDFGGLDVLLRYQKWRRFDNVTLAVSMDLFNRLFSNDQGLIRRVRDLGLAAVDRLAPAKRFFMAEAGGDVGDLPKLLRGEAL